MAKLGCELLYKNRRFCELNYNQNDAFAPLANHRFFGLDLARLIAALIVFIGHLLFSFSPDFYNLDNPPLMIDIFRFGALSVCFFFALSGFVLEPYLTFAKTNYKNWITSRLLRLYPVYLVCYVFPILPFIILKNEFPAPNFTIFVSLFGLQALSLETYLAPPNPPLWSLSIEIIFAFIFPFIPKTKKILLFSTLGLLLIVNQVNSLPPALNFLHYFYLGIILRKFLPAISKYLKPLIYLLWIPVALFAEVGITENHELLNLWLLTAVVVILFSFSNLRNSSIPQFLKMLSKRTYSLYAVHWPILVTLNYVISTYEFEMELKIYLLLAVILVLIVTEVIYRLVERPSMRIAKFVSWRQL
jgi:peptidoglycan/LPS O-acetylase OafA/YrhL